MTTVRIRWNRYRCYLQGYCHYRRVTVFSTKRPLFVFLSPLSCVCFLLAHPVVSVSGSHFPSNRCTYTLVNIVFPVSDVLLLAINWLQIVGVSVLPIPITCTAFDMFFFSVFCFVVVRLVSFNPAEACNGYLYDIRLFSPGLLSSLFFCSRRFF